MTAAITNEAILDLVRPDRAAGVINDLLKNMAEKPRQYVFDVAFVPVNCLVPGTNVLDVSPENLRHLSAAIWQALQVVPDIYPLLTLTINKDLGGYFPLVEILIQALRKNADPKVISGRLYAHEVRNAAARKLACVVQVSPEARFRLVVVHAGDRPDDASYRKELTGQAAKIGIEVQAVQLRADPSAEEVRALLEQLNSDDSVSGVMVQTIRKPGIDDVVRSTLRDDKDTEYLNIHHTADVFLAPYHTYIGAPSTALSCQKLIWEALPDLAGKNVVIINNSPVVGKPLAMLLTRHGATVTMCSKDTGRDLLHLHTRHADVIVSATGVRGLVGPEHVKPGVILIDVGINSVTTDDGKTVIVGDLDIDALKPLVSRYSEVPGGVGPLTTAYFLHNLASLCHHRYFAG